MSNIAKITLTVIILTTFAFADEWQMETIDETETGFGKGYCSDIAIDSNDNIHIVSEVYTDDIELPPILNYYYNDGSGWHISILDDNGGMQSIVLDSNDNPHVSYISSDGSYADLYYAYNDGTSWHIEEVVPDIVYCGVGAPTSIDIDTSGNLHIAVPGRKTSDPEMKLIKYAHFDGTSWTVETVEEEAGYHSSIAADTSGNPHISYYDFEDFCLKYAYHNGTKWEIEFLSTTGEGGGQHSSIDVDSLGNPHISHCNTVSGDRDLEYVYRDSSKGTWVFETPDSDYVGCYTSLQIDSSDNPYISYYDVANEDLKYTYKSGSSWEIEAIDTEGKVGTWTSLALDSFNNPHISYQKKYTGVGTMTWGDLKYAWFGSTDIEEDNIPNMPIGFVLHPAYPNPSSGITSIGYAIPSKCEVELSLYDIKGRKITTLATGTHQPGEYLAEVSGLSSGVYIYKIQADEFTSSKKMVVK